ncbi:hypothetical protein [Pseudomonas citronellolis]|uniref:hypothetical protein n=1 Tax=Pseudomonas citronellolis TaxID=53408 RepID=UPI003C2BE6AD
MKKSKFLLLPVGMLTSVAVFAEPQFYKCNDPIEISSCVVKGRDGKCTYKNISNATISSLGIFFYDKDGVQLGSDWRVHFYDMPPGQSKRDDFLIEEETQKVVFCSTDPASLKMLTPVSVQFERKSFFGFD